MQNVLTLEVGLMAIKQYVSVPDPPSFMLVYVHSFSLHITEKISPNKLLKNAKNKGEKI